MTRRDVSGHPLLEMLHLAFASLIEAGELDLVTLPDGDETEVQADHWTLHLEGWPITTAWIAIDQDPASAAEQLAALRDAFNHRELAALRDAAMQLDGVLLTCLRESGDELSIILAGLLDGVGSPPK